MKVDGPGSSGKLSQSKKTAKTGGAKGVGFSSALRQADGGADDTVEISAGGLAGGSGVSSIDALLALQGVDSVDATEPDAKRRNKAALDRGEDLLDQLDEIRIGLLSGGLSRQRLVQLQAALSQRASGALDPKVKSLVDDIELRVAVELAKHGQDD
ncbi:MAG: flagellar biosynthesis protein FlgI [Rhodospirillales bacterium]|nr:flagellar biosynthesis protein FlgI [Rhodospirillales bacterium]